MKRPQSILPGRKLDIEEFVFNHANWMLNNRSRETAVWYVNSLLEKYPKKRKAVLSRLSRM
ncbi:hypothetical protein [Sphingobacterium sp.]|uniref:hypothetical protein n=1 Tax=Sphingobacterium sp. TaxID=341027 RepID=UPI0028B209A0|nr:hypothetical protein [Sphingobacterium sp.]